MDTYYKATRMDGTDFRTGTVDYAGALETGSQITHPVAVSIPGDASTYFSVAVEPVGTLLGGSWPCRLFRVEPEGEVRVESAHRFKRSCGSLRVREELDSTKALGPQGEEVSEFIRLIPERLANASRNAACDAAWGAACNAAWDASWGAARDASRNAACDAACDAAWGGARNAARNAVGGAIQALLVKDLIASDQFDTLMRPWRVLTGGER